MTINKNKLLDVAVKLAEIHGYRNITRDLVAMNAGVAQGTVTNYLGTMKQMRRSILRHAIKHKNNRIIAQAASHADPYIMKRLTTQERIDAMVSVA